jgi:hypothetical protein
MLQISLLEKRSGMPRAVNDAFRSFQFFTTVAAQPVFGDDSSIRVLPISPDAYARRFLTDLLLKGGTDRDIEWLISEGVLSVADRSLWADVIVSYAEQEMDDFE